MSTATATSCTAYATDERHQFECARCLAGFHFNAAAQECDLPFGAGVDFLCDCGATISHLALIELVAEDAGERLAEARA